MCASDFFFGTRLPARRDPGVAAPTSEIRRRRYGPTLDVNPMPASIRFQMSDPHAGIVARKPTRAFVEVSGGALTSDIGSVRRGNVRRSRARFQGQGLFGQTTP